LDFGFPLNHPHARSIRIRSAHPYLSRLVCGS
jgi:hypothetical protein